MNIKIIENAEAVCFRNSYLRIDIQKIYEFPNEGNVWYLSAFYVQESYRSRGYGVKLLSLLAEYADKHKIRIICDVFSYGELDNDALIRLYNRFGFIERDSMYLKNSLIEDDKCCLIREFET